MLSKASEGVPRNHHASGLTGFNLFLLVVALSFIPSSHAFAQLPNLQCNDTLSLFITTQGFHLAERSCITIEFENDTLNSGCVTPDPMCCEPWARDPLVCDPPGDPHNCNDTNGIPVNDCCCWNTLTIHDSDGKPVWKYSWRGCRTIWDGNDLLHACLNAGDYYWDPDYSTDYQCRRIFVEISCPGCCP